MKTLGAKSKAASIIVNKNMVAITNGESFYTCAENEVISAHDIKRTYVMGETKVQALRGVSLNVTRGEMLALIGPSGSGKSTLMHIIGCLDKPDSGSIFIDGIETAKMNERMLASVRNKKIGFVFQSFNLLARLSILENVALPLQYSGVSLKERMDKARAELEAVGLQDRMQHKPNELSGGQKQRAAIARALVNKPAIILADEPTGALDSKTGRNILDLFHEIHEKGTTVIVVTHDMSVAQDCKRRIALKDGLTEQNV